MDQREQWELLGDKVKLIEGNLRQVLKDSESLGINDKTLLRINRAMGHIRKFKNDSENIMLSRMRKSGQAFGLSELTIFYGQGSEEVDG